MFLLPFLKKDSTPEELDFDGDFFVQVFLIIAIPKVKCLKLEQKGESIIISNMLSNAIFSSIGLLMLYLSYSDQSFDMITTCGNQGWI